MAYQFDNHVTLNDEAIPYTTQKIEGKEHRFIYSFGNNKFQCPELRKVISLEESKLLYEISQRKKKNGAYYAKFNGHFDIEGKRFFLMKIFFENAEEREWDTWLIPKEYTERINKITHDFNDRSGV